VNTLLLLLDRHRQDFIVDTIDTYIFLANEERGIADAIVHSIRPLKEDEKEAISSVFAAKVAKRSLNIENKIDKDLLGGIKIEIGNLIYDGSLRHKLDHLERSLIN